MLGRLVVFGLFLLVGGCGSKPTPLPTTPTATDIPASVSGPLSANLAALAQSLSGQSALAAQGAALALQAGVQAIPVNLTASVIAAPPTGSRSSALNSGGPGSAFAYQLTVYNPPVGSNPQVYSGVLAYVDGSDATFAMGTSPAGTFEPPPAAASAVGSIFLGGDTGIWHATMGNESAQLDTQNLGPDCTGALPSYVTSCTQQDSFSNAGFDITASTPVGAATGSKMAAMPLTNNVPGVALTIDYTLVSVSVYPLSQTVMPGGTVQFMATVTGPPNTNTAVNWSVTGSAGGTINSSTGLYTAASTAGTDTVVATQVGSTVSGSATVTVANPSVTFFNYWGPAQYSLTDATSGSTLATGSVTFSINDSEMYGLYMALLCVVGGEVAATSVPPDSSTGTFNITGLITGMTCPFVGQAPPCAPTISYSGGTGTLDAGPPATLTISFEGTVTGLDPNNCMAANQYNGMFGPAAVYTAGP